jgi:hypothetical protein
VVDLDAALGEQLFNIAVGQAKAQIPADRQDDDVGWEPEAGEGRLQHRSRMRTRSHADSLAARTWSQRTQQCPAELVHQGQAALHHGGTIDYFIHATFNVPTESDVYKYAAYDGLQRLQARSST